jgi:hypothetical protein
MTERERWIVYPLLFLALGITVKDKLPPKHIEVDEVRSKRAEVDEMRSKRMDADEVRCAKLVVADRGNREHVIVGSTPGGGIIEFRGERAEAGTIILGYFNNAAVLMFRDARGILRWPLIGWETLDKKATVQQPAAEPAPPADGAAEPSAPAPAER